MTSASSPQTTATRPYQLTSEQQAMARELRNYLSLQWPVSRVRELADGVPGGQLDRRTRTEGDALVCRGPSIDC